MSIVPNAPQTPQGSPALLDNLQSEVAVEAAPLLQFIVRYMGVIVSVLVLLILALAGTAGYNWYKNNAREKAQAEMQKVLQGAQGSERIAALEAFIPRADDSVRASALLALANAAIDNKLYDKAAAAYGQVSALDATGPVGLMAGLNQGQLLLKAGKAAEALAVLDKLENLFPEGQRSLVRQLVVDAAVLAGDKQRAATALKALEQHASGTERAWFAHRLANLGVAPVAGAEPGTEKATGASGATGATGATGAGAAGK